MAVQRFTEFCPGSRYVYDFGPCSDANGWAQVDTRQDASYYGNWTNPTARELFSYCEGDTTLIRCETDDEYVAQVREMADWHQENGYWKGIDPGLGADLRARFEALGLSDLLHGGER